LIVLEQLSIDPLISCPAIPPTQALDDEVVMDIWPVEWQFVIVPPT